MPIQRSYWWGAMEIVDPDTGKRVLLHPDDELQDDLNQHHLTRHCHHNRIDIRRAVVGGGQVQFRQQCLDCGEGVGTAIARAAAPKDAADFDRSIAEKRNAAYLAGREAILLKHLKRQKAKIGAYWVDYNKYLASPEWAAKRDLVLKRAKFVCEGCGERPAVAAHHLTYKNKFREFLFELVAVCQDCHKRLHDGEGISEPPGPIELPDKPAGESDGDWVDEI